MGYKKPPVAVKSLPGVFAMNNKNQHAGESPTGSILCIAQYMSSNILH